MQESEIEELQRERFVDGELSPQQEDDFLAACEAQPERYRSLALSFVEARRWSQALREGPLSFAIKQQPQPPQKLQPIAASRPAAVDRLSWTRWLSGLAAALLIGAFTGYLAAPVKTSYPLSPVNTPSDAPTRLAQQTDSPNTKPLDHGPQTGASDQPPAAPASANNLANASLPDTNQDTHQAVNRAPNRQPLGSLGDRQTLAKLVRHLEPQPMFPQSTVEQLASDGVMVDQSTRLFLIELPDGQQLAVPAQFINLSHQSP
ncbi:hypothetical protein SH139x_001418 [Planctomycetaceae bacterium SH139]